MFLQFKKNTCLPLGVFPISLLIFFLLCNIDKRGRELIKQDSVVSVSFTDQHEII